MGVEGGNIIKELGSNPINLSNNRIRSLNLILFGNGILLKVWGQVNYIKMYFRRNHLEVLCWINWSWKRREAERNRPIRVVA